MIEDLTHDYPKNYPKYTFISVISFLDYYQRRPQSRSSLGDTMRPMSGVSKSKGKKKGRKSSGSVYPQEPREGWRGHSPDYDSDELL